MDFAYKVSIVMLAYNHGKYIKQALDSIFAQEVKFTFELLIGEDCSQDNTKEIAIEYQRRYPEYIKLFLSSENIGMKENFNRLISSCQGEYVAYLEGDDYWCDTLKLQKQVDFLDNNHSFIGTTHNVRIIDSSGKYMEQYQNLYPIKIAYTYGLSDFENGEWPSQTAAYLHRNFIWNLDIEVKEQWLKLDINPDQKLVLLLVLLGDIYFFADIMSSYRYIVSGGTNWNSTAGTKNYSSYYIDSIMEEKKFAEKLFGKELSLTKQMYNVLCGSYLQLFRHPSKDNMRIVRYVGKKIGRKKGILRFMYHKLLEHFKKQYK